MLGNKRQSIGLLVLLVLSACCAIPARGAIGGEQMNVLQIRWIRLVDEKGRTCDRCGTTETAVEEAVNKLKGSLKGLGIDVTLEKSAISPSEFSKDTLQSNRIWINGKPIEEWLWATSGQSKCCTVCGESDCRTVTVGGKTYEAIPSELIVKAGLHAAAELLHDKPVSPCCPPAEPPKKGPGCCPPSSPLRTK
ncbi:MAG: DUF2703 domain-containing protein [bacterium]|jgi:hypothetical protein